MKLYLKIKLKHLCAETQIINRMKKKLQRAFDKTRERMAKRGEDPKALTENPLLNGIHNHRKNVVSAEARASYLAYGFLRGRSYDELETIRYTSPNWDAVKRIAHFFNLGGSPTDGCGTFNPKGVYIPVEMFDEVFANWRGNHIHMIRPKRKKKAQIKEETPGC